MASDIITGTSEKFQVRIVWSSTSNGTEANSSNVTVEVQIKKGSIIPTWGTWTITNRNYGFTIPSGTTNEYYASVSNNWVTLEKLSGVVKHEANGYKRITFVAWVKAPDGTTLEGVISKCSGFGELDKIPQHAYINNIEATTFNSIDTAPTINYTNPAGNDLTALDVCISLDTQNDDIPYRAISKTDTSHKIVLTQNDLNTLYKAMPNSNSLTTYVQLRSTIGELVKITKLAKEFYIEDKSINLNINIEDTNEKTIALTGDKNTLIKGYSNAKVTLDASPATIGSTITARTIKNGTTIYKDSVGIYNNIDNGKFEVSATDSRGNTSTKTQEVLVVNYIPLTCNLTVEMPDIQGNADITIEGNYFNGNFGMIDNNLTILVRQITNGVEGQWQTVTDVTIRSNSYSASATLGGFSQTEESIVEIKVTDKLLTKEAAQNVLIIPVFDWGKEDFNFNVPVNINGDLTVSGSINFDYGNQNILWSGAQYMPDDYTAELNKSISEQANGIVLVFSRYNDSGTEPLDEGWNSFFVPKSIIDINNGGAQCFILSTGGFSHIATKYLIISDNAIKGNANNEANGTINGITYNNKAFVLRYVIGL